MVVSWLFHLDDSNHCVNDGCFTKHPFKTGCLGFQVDILVERHFRKSLCRFGRSTSIIHMELDQEILDKILDKS